MTSLAVVTDSTASLTSAVAAAHGITVVPLQVTIGEDTYEEGVGIDADTVAEALRARRPVSTSRPGPEVFARTYQDLAKAGADAIVSVHLSSEVSGTCESAQLAAERVSVPVRVVDTRQVGIATGLAAIAAASCGDADEASRAALTRAEHAAVFFYVDTLEYLRRGGRIGTGAALIGSALAVKPLLTLDDGRIGPLAKVRTASRAIARLRELALERARTDAGDVVVQHLANAERAAELAGALSDSLDQEVPVSEVGAVLGVHVGPGLIAVTVAGT